MIRRIALCVVLLLVRASLAHAQRAIELRDAGPGPGPQILVRAINAPHTVVPPASSEYLVRRDTAFAQTVIVLGRDVVVEGTIHGDLIVVAGDLYMHPGGQIDGQAVAFGGGVYESSLARVGAGVTAFREFTYDISATAAGFALTYRPLSVSHLRAFRLTGIYGLNIPGYDRTNGVSLPIGAALAVRGTRLRIEPTITYRSQLGRADPSIIVSDSVARGVAFAARVGRSTFSNEAWINSDLLNGLTSLATGNDARNYFRATRGEATIAWRSGAETTSLVSYLGLRGERASTVRPGLGAAGGPWSFKGRRDVDDMLRPNPSIDDGRIASLLTGSGLTWEAEGVVARAALDIELGRATIDAATADNAGQTRNFAQATFDGAISFPTFGTQSLRFEGHGVLTSRGQTPRQRWAYLGGSGTLSPLEMLELGGDQLIYVDGRYSIPLDRVQLPFVGAPTVTLRDAFGGAALQGAPTIHQAVGVRLSLMALYTEFMIDPATRHNHLGFGFSLAR